MTMRAILLVGTLALAGCQSAAERQAAQTGVVDIRNGSMKDVTALTKAAREKLALKPGTWESGMEVLSADFNPGPDAETQIAAVKKQQRHAIKCQTAGDLKPLDIENLEKVAGSCTFPRYIQKDGKLDVQISCTQANGATTLVSAAGTMRPEGYDVTITQQSGEKGGDGYAAIKLRAYGKRMGLCQGKAAG